MKLHQDNTKPFEGAGVTPCRKNPAVLVAGSCLQAAVARNDTPGRHPSPVRNTEATFSETLLGPRVQGQELSTSRLDSVASGAATLPPSRAPSRSTCPSIEGDHQPSDFDAHSPVEELQERWTDELTEFRRSNMQRTRKGRFAKMPEDPNGKDAFCRRATIGETGLTFPPSDVPVVARALPNSSSLPDVFVRTHVQGYLAHKNPPPPRTLQ